MYVVLILIYLQQAAREETHDARPKGATGTVVRLFGFGFRRLPVFRIGRRVLMMRVALRHHSSTLQLYVYHVADGVEQLKAFFHILYVISLLLGGFLVALQFHAFII